MAETIQDARETGIEGILEQGGSWEGEQATSSVVIFTNLGFVELEDIKFRGRWLLPVDLYDLDRGWE